MSDIQLQLSASANISGQTGVNPWQLQNPVTYSQTVPAALGPQEAVQVVTHRGRGALHDQRETGRRGPLHQQREFLAASHQHKWLRGKILSVFWQGTQLKIADACSTART